MLAISNGGTLITDKWHGASKPYEFMFADGRKFTQLISGLRRIGWPKDPGLYFRKNKSKETSVELMAACSKIAEYNGGKFLSKEWQGSQQSYCFEHSNGTVFWIRLGQLQQRGWPKDISKFVRYQQDHLQIMRDIAEQNGGKLISNQWIGSLRKYKFQFKSGLDFEYTWNSLQIFGWPRDEDLYVRRYHPNRHLMHYLELQKIAKSRGGELLSKEYAGSRTSHLFKDQAGIEFWMSPHEIRKGCWSPKVGLISEPVCRQVMIHLFGGQFRSTRRVVIRSGKSSLELDGYEDNVSLPDGHYPVAFEYQGDNSHRYNQEVRSCPNPWCKFPARTG